MSKVWYWQVVCSSTRQSRRHAETSLQCQRMPDLHQPASSPSSLSTASERLVSNNRLLLCFFLLQRVSRVSIHRLLGVNHNFLETLSKNLRDVRKQWAEEKGRTLSLEGAMLGRTLQQMRQPLTRKIGAMKRSIVPSQLSGSNGVALLNAVALSLFSFGPPSRTMRETCSRARCDSQSRMGIIGFQASEGQTSDPTHRCCKVIQNQGAWSPSLTT